MNSNSTLIAEALTTLTILLKAYYGWYLAFIATLTALLLTLTAVLNLLYNHHRHPRKNTSP
ncbi:hypothetical protein [Streptomyces sp. NPDC101455]|uniref:hypothetical protein n=1 Tax=Streptomyces sp. NPDC101455 TaxID=3366142 RepID=UPI00382ECA8F